MKRFVVIVLDGFGIGAMEDTVRVRPQDQNANTLKSILKDFPDMKLPNLEKLGLMNAAGFESREMKFSKEANFGKISLKHFGADTFMGHQEIMGTDPKKPEVHPFKERVGEVAAALKEAGHNVEIIRRGDLEYLLVDKYVTVADNLEADPGMCYNLTAPIDYISFEKEVEIGRIVRAHVSVGRVIVFGGRGNNMDDIWAAEEIKENRFIGIASAKSKSYEKDYHCIHLGYGVDPKVQAPYLLRRKGIETVLIGKVADIVDNEGLSISCVDTKQCMDHTIREFKKMKEGFICTNIQETDLAGHSQSAETYKKVLEIADKSIGELLENFGKDDVLLVQADHGNDPDIGHSKHTREYVPMLIYRQGHKGHNYGIRDTLSDVGATVCSYFGAEEPQNGKVIFRYE